MRTVKIHNFVLIVMLILSLTVNTRLTAMAAVVLPDAGTYSNTGYSPLYSASNFHIFALESATLGAHTFGNVATGKLDGRNNFGMPGVLDDISYVRQIDRIDSSTTASTFVVGKDVLVELVDNGNKVALAGSQMSNISKDKFKMDYSGKYIDLENEFDKLTKLSEYIGKLEKTQGSEIYFEDRNDRKIICARDKINVIPLKYEYFTMDTDLKIQGLYPSEGGTVILNIDLNGVADAVINSKIDLTFDGNHLGSQHRTDFKEGHILWNFYDSSDKDYCYRGNITINQLWLGSILAPGATVSNRVNLDGTIIAKKFINAGGETHRWDFTGEIPKVEPTPTPTPTEEASPTPTPTPTEEATPTPTPTKEASPTPTPTKEASPTPTPTKEASPTPTPTKEASPTPTPTEEASPTPTPTEEATPTPTKDASPTPTPTEDASPTPTPTDEVGPSPTDEANPTPTDGITPPPTDEATPTKIPILSPTPVDALTPEPTPTDEITLTPDLESVSSDVSVAEISTEDTPEKVVNIPKTGEKPSKKIFWLFSTEITLFGIVIYLKKKVN